MRLRYPRLTGATSREQLQELERYLRYLVDQINHLMEKG